MSPLPDSYDASSRTQISLLGAPVQALSALHVSGSDSGSHSGRLRAYSQGDGASFVPAKPFSQGETVTVRGAVKVGARAQRFAYHFVVAEQDVLPYTPPTPPSGKDYNEKQHFHSAPTLEPPLVTVTARSPQSAPGDIFAAPYTGPGPPGPMIFDEAGNLVWFDSLPKSVAAAANLQVQQLDGKPVLTWWQGYIPPQGFGQGEEIIANNAYQQIGRVHARQRLQSRPARLPHNAAGHGRADGVQRDRLQPVGRRRSQRRRGDRQRVSGNRSAHGARAARVAQPRPRAVGRLLQLGHRIKRRMAVSTTSTSTRSTSAPTARR